METAVGVDSRFQFSATYYGPSLGFGVNKIGGTASSDSCYWLLYVKSSDDSDPVLSPVGPSHFSVCSEIQIIWRYGLYEA